MRISVVSLLKLPRIASEPRPSPFMRSVISRACAECNCEFAHTQLHSAHAREITDSINGEGLGSEASQEGTLGSLWHVP